MHWQTPEEADAHLATPEGREAFEDELCDVLFSLLLLAHDRGVDLPAAYRRKMAKNAVKYPAPAERGG